jgi:hypothetical protein
MNVRGLAAACFFVAAVFLTLAALNVLVGPGLSDLSEAGPPYLAGSLAVPVVAAVLGLYLLRQAPGRHHP